MTARSLVSCLLFAAPLAVFARYEHHDHAVHMDRGGVVMNANTDRLPRGCEQTSDDLEFTIFAGSAYAGERPGVIFGMSEHEVRVPPCSRLTIHFVNEDAVRHQWMVHGLPRYLYPAGMFHIEAMGGQRQSGTFIVPPEDRTYLIHCDMAQHMEKGMRGQLIVGRGSGTLWGVTGISDAFYRSAYLPSTAAALVAALAVISFAVTVGWKVGRPHRAGAGDGNRKGH